MPVDPACTPPRRVDARPRAAWPLHDIATTRAIEHAALAARPAHQLMARAGLAVARLALSLAEPGRGFWVAAGPGNNGGDGLVAATWLHRWGQSVQVDLCARPERLPEDAAWALQRARSAGVPITVHDPQSALPTGDDACPDLPPDTWIIDALLGIGSRNRAATHHDGDPDQARSAPARPAAQPPAHADGAVQALIAHIQRMREERRCRVLAIDLPSGLDADTGHPPRPPGLATKPAVIADHTLSLLTLKPGLCTGDGPHHAGTLWWHGLGVVATPDGASTEAATDRHPPVAWRLPDPRWLARETHRHKGSYGDVLVLGGSDGMAGAARLAADAALQAGAGRVWIGRPVDAGTSTTERSATSPESTTPTTLPQDLPPELMQAPIEQMCSADRLARSTVVCGCGGGEAIALWLPEVLRHARRLVIDADALNAIAKDEGLRLSLRERALAAPASCPWPTLLTPHPLEAARLLGREVAAVQNDRLQAARELARISASVVLLKGSGTVLATPDGEVWINPRGSARLATPGSGDVLAGWIGGTWSACGDAGAHRLWPAIAHARPAPADGEPTNAARPPASAVPPDPARDPTLAVAAACAWLHGLAGEAPPRGLPLRAGELARAMVALTDDPGSSNSTTTATG